MDDPQLIDPLKIAVPFFVLLVLAEMIYARMSGRAKFEPRDSAASLVMGLGNLVSGIVFGLVTIIWFQFVGARALFDFGWSWPVWIIALIADDFLYYWSHRWAHTVRWYWADHVVHHSSQHYNLTTALRQPWISPLTFKFLWLGSALIFLGFPPAMIAFVGSINLIYQFWIHTEAVGRLPKWFEAVMNTPSHHRVHHATNPIYLDKNYAGIFIIWDRMFGSFQPELDEERCRYGIVKNLGSDNPLVICFHEWVGIFNDLRRAKSPKEAFMYAFGRPGWSPDGSRLTSEGLLARWKARQVKTPAAAEQDATPAE